MSREEAEKILKSQNYHIMEPGEADYFGTVAGNAYPVDYPLFNYFYGKKNCREKVVQGMVFNYRVMAGDGLCYSFEDKSMGNVAILPPGTPRPGMMQYIKKGGLGLIFKIGLGAMMRMSKYEDYSEKIKQKYSDDKTWYFENLAIAKEHQGNKMVAGLTIPLIMYLDSIGANIYFETHSQNNVAIYEHYGFKVVEKGKIPGTDLEHFAMIRRAPSEKAQDQ